MDKITALREILHKKESEVPKNQKKALKKATKKFLEIFPDFATANRKAYKQACEVTEHLTAGELLLLYGYFLKNGVSPMLQILMLAKKHMDKTGMDETLAVVEKVAGPEGFFALSNLVGTRNLDSKWLVKYLEACIRK